MTRWIFFLLLYIFKWERYLNVSMDRMTTNAGEKWNCNSLGFSCWIDRFNFLMIAVAFRSHSLTHNKKKHTNSINIYIQSIRNRNYLMWKLSETNIYSYFLFWIQKMETAQTVVIWYISFTFSIKKMARMIVNIAKFAMSESSHQWNLRFANSKHTSKLTQIELPSLCAQKCIPIQQKPLVDQNIRCKIMPIWRRTTNVKTSVQAHSERIGMNPLGCFSFGFVWSGYSIMAGFAFQTMASFCFCFHNFVLILLDCIQTFELSSNDLVGIELNFVHLEPRY